MKALAIIMIVFMPAADGGVATAEFYTMEACVAAKQKIEQAVRVGAWHPVALCVRR